MSLRKRISRLRPQAGRGGEGPTEAGREGAAPSAAAERQKEAAERARRAAERERKAAGRSPSKRRPARSGSKLGRPMLSRPKPKRGAPAGSPVSASLRKPAGAVVTVAAEAAKLGKEMLAIPLELWLAVAEVAGGIVLKVWSRALWPLFASLWRFAVASIRFGERHLTPARGVAAVALVALVALAASQWLDYRAISVGTDAYSGSLGVVAPPPQVSSEIAGHAHGWVMVPLAVAGLVFLGLAIAGRRRAAALLIAVGIAAIVISIVVDAPQGLDKGSAALAYDSVSATLLEGFWLQIACGAVLVACGLMLPRYLRPAPATGPAPTGPSLLRQAARWLQGRRPNRPLARGLGGAKRRAQGAGT